MDSYLEKRSAMALFLPLAETMDISLAVTLSDWDSHCLRLKGATEAIFAVRLSNQSLCQAARSTRHNSERREGVNKKEERV